MRKADTDEWSGRIGTEAAGLIERSITIRRAGGASLLLCVALEIGFQLANYYRPGIVGSLVFFPTGMVGISYPIRWMAQARRLVAARLGLPPQQAKFVRLRHGTQGYDRWLAARHQPGWPSSGW